MKKCLLYLVSALISILLLIITIFQMKNEINFSSLKMFDNNNNYRLLNSQEKNEKKKFFP